VRPDQFPKDEVVIQAHAAVFPCLDLVRKVILIKGEKHLRLFDGTLVLENHGRVH
jgi:hypothetical protein